ncbi:MAG: alpha/beta hydrolase [Cyclobacteriaceae bacterium]|nr:alpha/beta hydrolase [Cyclobacteriaceae bacterium]
MSRKLVFITFPILLIIGVYFMGPEPDQPAYDPAMPPIPNDIAQLVPYVAMQEFEHKIKPDNEARIVWADSSMKQTEFSVVYLHGFSASQAEGDPIHKQFAKTFGCNLYLARMADHGIDTTEQLLYFTPDRWWKSSKEALAIGKMLGDKVIVMGTSTGATMGLILAAEYPQDVFALINMSPNIAINDPAAFISNNPWGLQLARMVKKGNYNVPGVKPGVDVALNNQYWNDKYRLEAVCQLEELLETKMTKSTFEKIKQPVLNLYYYKNEQEQDQTVKVSAILEMHSQLSTPESDKVAVPVPNAGAHVLGSYIVSGDLETVASEAKKFAIEKLKMKPVGQ